MNRASYFNFIEEKLSLLATRIEMRGHLNFLDVNIHAEIFYRDLFNLLFGWNLEKTLNHNAAGIDLVDTGNRLVVQVSATVTKAKIESALNKDLSPYMGYRFKFIAIAKNADALRKHKGYANPHRLDFAPDEDIYDVRGLLAIIGTLPNTPLGAVYAFLKKEFKNDAADPEKMESHLATIIALLAKEDWSQSSLSFETVPYAIEDKISYNQLNAARGLIDDYKIHYARVDNIYTDFNQLGANKSLSVLGVIRTEYLALMGKQTPDDCFFLVIDKIIGRVVGSANYVPIAREELELCIQILVVDAFIRCKIFKNPLGEPLC